MTRPALADIAGSCIPRRAQIVSAGERLHTCARTPTGRQRRVEVVPADGSVQIQNFAGEIQAWRQLALHVSGIDFIERHPASGDLRFLEAERATDLYTKALQRIDKNRPVRST